MILISIIGIVWIIFKIQYINLKKGKYDTVKITPKSDLDIKKFWNPHHKMPQDTICVGQTIDMVSVNIAYGSRSNQDFLRFDFKKSTR